MAYCDFTLPDIKRQLHCIIDETTDLFASVGEVREAPGSTRPCVKHCL